MSGEAPALVRSFRVGPYRCTITLPQFERGAVKCFVVEWSPSVPRRLSAKQMRQYQQGRDSAMAELAAMIGGNVLVVE